MKKDLSKTQTGTPYYASPEVWKDEAYDWRSDIWSLGCVLYEMTTLKPPFRAANMEGLYKKVLKGVYPRINQKTYSEDLSAVIKSLLQLKPDLRPSCQEILEMQEVKQYERELELEPDMEVEDSKHNKEHVDLIKTIRMPKKLHFLQERLPKPMYQVSLKDIEEEEQSQMSSKINLFQENNQNYVP